MSDSGSTDAKVEKIKPATAEKKTIDVKPVEKKTELVQEVPATEHVDSSTPVSNPKISKSPSANISDVSTTKPVAANASPSYSSVLKKTSLAAVGQNVVKEAEPEKTQPEKKDNIISTPVDQEKLDKAWNEFAAKEKAAGKHQLFSTLTHRKPKLISDDLIELEIVNISQENLLNEEKKALMDYLRSALKNDKIQFQVKLLDSPKDETVYTAKEKYQKMVERNPALEEMRKKLGLE